MRPISSDLPLCMTIILSARECGKCGGDDSARCSFHIG